MLDDLLSFKDKCSIASKHVAALKLYANIFNKEKQKIKHKFIYPIRKAGFSMKDALGLNFKVCKGMWANCLNQKIQMAYGFKSKEIKTRVLMCISCALSKASEATGKTLAPLDTCQLIHGLMQSLSLRVGTAPTANVHLPSHIVQ